ncbi:hypothetical protein AAC387_Pa05g0630 [Persea americana]
MIKEFPQQKHQLSEVENKEMKQKTKQWSLMENPDLTLGLPRFIVTTESNNSSSLESEPNSRRKRKYPLDHLTSDSMTDASIELQLKDPLPSGWEQCLDLESGAMYYLNKKTARRSYNWPLEQNIDLDLNISTLSSSDEMSSKNLEESKKPSKSNSSSTMVAAACFKCHLLVMLSKSSPSCPNCKYLHSLPTQPSPPPEVTTANSLETLCLLN